MFTIIGGGVQQYLINSQLYLVPNSALPSLLLTVNDSNRMILHTLDQKTITVCIIPVYFMIRCAWFSGMPGLKFKNLDFIHV